MSGVVHSSLDSSDGSVSLDHQLLHVVEQSGQLGHGLFQLQQLAVAHSDLVQHRAGLTAAVQSHQRSSENSSVGAAVLDHCPHFFVGGIGLDNAVSSLGSDTRSLAAVALAQAVLSDVLEELVSGALGSVDLSSAAQSRRSGSDVFDAQLQLGSEAQRLQNQRVNSFGSIVGLFVGQVQVSQVGSLLVGDEFNQARVTVQSGVDVLDFVHEGDKVVLAVFVRAHFVRARVGAIVVGVAHGGEGKSSTRTQKTPWATGAGG
ncbi:hypothetical protein EJF18_50657 [Clavispora lusitaniae]|uniref:Uncharacterized protein n=1 Tax=Clavispora lusitaniae TaxID=36911 RepID=A0ACD0WPD9_CLALS|nr:hypothetical protein EJF14_50657 [Clavispora lusitaniae]QFZ35080.1 hypothetical protein EJF16_50657 [Clavispora lusitaniae]QFZ40765.1 hypothetical protein EJF15_50657 [Clavispora lusitaniae]QFZ46445.1 hypothetical protein EJF18_50657 [Clavispora lusitaniae]QFZ52107.1 hypothetical protein EJF17_50657 [Clavispora lusitaniae]